MSKKKYPIVSIVGRPNVGKSSLFNRIIKKRKAIVHEMSGVTRDRLDTDVFIYDKPFKLIDTGGIITGKVDFFTSKIKEQAEIAIETSDVIVFLVDGTEGLTKLDLEVADILRKAGKKVYLAVNKIDNVAMEMLLADFYELGFENIYPVSALHGLNVNLLVQDVLEQLPSVKKHEHEKPFNIAIVGRPNVGKSSLINKLLNQERVVVSDIPGTTRDSIDVQFSRRGKLYKFVDTAGMRYKRKTKKALEYYSLNRATKSIERSDFVILLIDTEEGLTTLELKILQQIKDSYRPCILAVNKWDKTSGVHQKDYVKKCLDRVSSSYSYIPIAFISALEGMNIERLFTRIENTRKELGKRITTGVLNRFFIDLIQSRPPRYKHGKRFKLYYVCQAEVGVPTFMFSVNNKKLLDDSYKRFLENRLREKFGFDGVPVRFRIVDKGEK